MSSSPVDWTAPPYTVGGIVELFHPGEEHASVTPDERRRRLVEYTAQWRARIRLAAELAAAAGAWPATVAKARAVFDSPRLPDSELKPENSAA